MEVECGGVIPLHSQLLWEGLDWMCFGSAVDVVVGLWVPDVESVDDWMVFQRSAGCSQP